MSKKWIALLLPIVMLTGCDLREDLSVCGVLRLNFSFTNNEDDRDRLQEDIKGIRVYKFDSEGWLAEVIEPTAADIARGWMEIENPKTGEFTFSAWGGSTATIGESGFLEMEMDDAVAAEYRDLWDDPETRLEDFYMVVDHERTPDAEIPGDAAAKEGFADLYQDSVEKFDVVAGEDQSIDFDFVRNTNVLDVTVNGIQYLPTRAVGDAPAKLFGIGRNGRYKWNNEIDGDALLVRYEPPIENVTATSMQVDIKILRLDEERHGDDPFMLHMTDPVTGEDLIEPIDVIDAVSRMVNDTRAGTLTQEYLDDVYEFPITINLSYDLSARIFINEWELVTPQAEL